MRAVACALVLAFAVGCGTSAPSGPPVCTATQELFEGKCVDPAERYEPDQREDTDNVVSFGDASLLNLPDPPKSGFRIIAPDRKLKPGEEAEFCLSWPYPTIKNKIIYAGRIYTTEGLHHSNLIAKPIDPMVGKNPYPHCHPGASDPFNKVLEGVIPDVLFANTTQIDGGETLAFPAGVGYRIDTTREMNTDMHLLNTSSSEQTVEVAYDFFTMPEEKLVNEVAPWALQIDQFDIPPHSEKTIGSSCAVFGGDVVEMMPHTHKRRTSFTIDYVGGKDNTPDRIETYGPPDRKSEIKVYWPALSLNSVNSISFSCTFKNEMDQDIQYGIGQNEMCVLFGYVYPVKMQFVGHAPDPVQPCQSVQLGLFR